MGYLSTTRRISFIRSESHTGEPIKASPVRFLAFGRYDRAVGVLVVSLSHRTSELQYGEVLPFVTLAKQITCFVV